MAAKNPTPSSIIAFTRDMFFAFDGIGLVLPVANTFGLQQESFPRILISIMSVEFADYDFMYCCDDDWMLLGHHRTFLGPRWSSFIDV